MSMIIAPVAPPRPLASGQFVGFGSAASATAVMTRTKGNSRSRSHQRPCRRSRMTRHPQTMSTTLRMNAAKPRLCSARSARIAPGRPSRLRARESVALLSDGSVRWKLISAAQYTTPRAMSAQPPASINRRRRKSRAPGGRRVMRPI
jgi:hypothetical protein